MKIILGDDTFEEEMKPSKWSVITDGNVSLGPAQITDPENVLLRTQGAPKLEDIGAAIWRRVPGDFSVAKNPWKGIKSGVAELESVFQNDNDQSKWKVLLRGQQRRYIVVQVYKIEVTP